MIRIQTLTEKLAAFTEARETMAAKEAEITELLDTEGLVVAADFDIEQLQDYKLDAQAAVDTANADLSAARALDFADYDNTTGVNDADAAFFTALNISGRMTDANVAAVVTAAKAAVKADKALYDVEGNPVADEDGVPETGYSAVFSNGTAFAATAVDSTYKLLGYVDSAAVTNVAALTADTFKDEKIATFSATALESRDKAADAALANHVTAAGTQAEVLAKIAESAAAYVAQNSSTQATAFLTAYTTALNAAAPGAAGDASKVLLTDVQTQLTALIDAAFAGDTASGDLDVETIELADNARGDALAADLAIQVVRDTLTANAVATETAFVAVEAGADLRTAEELQAERDAAKQTYQDALDTASELNALIESYETAEAEFNKIADELGYVAQDLDTAFEFSTEEADLFVFNLENFQDSTGALTLDATTVNDLAAGDALFFNGYVQGTSTGDNNVLELFITQVGADTVVTVETVAYGAAAGADNIEITLTGVAMEQVTFVDGLLTIA